MESDGSTVDATYFAKTGAIVPIQIFLQKSLAMGRDYNYRCCTTITMAPNTALKLAIFMKRKTQTVLAKRAGISESRLSRIINGHADATDDEKKAIAKALRQPIAELFTETAA